jgi:nitrogenase-associated protein
MAQVIFYEKPGCKGNARQKAVLESAGHTVLARNLKAERWSAEGLLAFLSPLPVSEWFNPSAPAVKSGEISPESLTPEQALPLLLGNPLLVRRPLLQVGEERLVGFNLAAVDAWIGLSGAVLPQGNIEACVHAPGQCGEPEGHAEDHHCGEAGGEDATACRA